jgi:hypothetical protein
VPGLQHLDGLALVLDHVQDIRLRPLDVILLDHFKQCIMRRAKRDGIYRGVKWDNSPTGPGMILEEKGLESPCKILARLSSRFFKKL